MSETRVYTTPNQLQLDSFKLAANVVVGKYRPTHILALLRGGGPIGMYIQELLTCTYDYRPKLVFATTKRIEGDNGTYTIETDLDCGQFDADTQLLVVDDIFDTGSTMAAIINMLLQVTKNVRSAVVDYKPGKNRTTLTPDYYVNMRASDVWIVYPHEISCLKHDDIVRAFGEEIAQIVLACNDIASS